MACIGVAYSDPQPIEVEYAIERLLPDLLVGVSQALAMVDQTDAIYPCFGSSCLDSGGGWVMLADLALRGKACMGSEGGGSLEAIEGNLVATLQLVGDLAADILGSLPLIIELQYPIDFLRRGTRGWIRLDAQSLCDAQVPELIETDASTRQRSYLATLMAEGIGDALFADPFEQDSWERGYLPGIGAFVEVDLYDLPTHMNSVSEWVEALSEIVRDLDPERVASLPEGENLIVVVKDLVVAFHFSGTSVYFVIGKDSLDDPDSWRICYRSSP